MYEAALPLADRLVAVYPINRPQTMSRKVADRSDQSTFSKLGAAPPTAWRNLSDLDQIVTELLATGRVESAALLLERAYPPERASWEVIDRIATLWLHLGEPAGPVPFGRRRHPVPRPAVRDARIGTTYLVEGDLIAARRFYGQSLQAEPDLFEARYSLAVLEQDAGDATAALEHARKAMETAPDGHRRVLPARTIALSVERFARRTGNAAIDDRRGTPDGRGSPARLP